MTSKPASISSIFLLFFLSGISGLIYETVWLRILSRVLGNTVYATSIVIAAFMAGLGLGSYLSGRYAGRFKNLLRLYAYLELGIAFSAFILLPLFAALIPLYRCIYTLIEAQRLWLSLFQALIMFSMLLIPTSLMGGTLPLLSTHTKKYHAAFVKRLGTLYGINTLGAFVGVIGSGFIFIGALGERQTILIGVLINLIVALAAYALSKKGQHGAMPAEESTESAAAENNGSLIPRQSAATKKLVLAAYGLNGFIAISYEIVWSRIFQIQVGTSLYAFSLMLGWYLVGIAAGSLCGAKYIDRIKAPLRFFGLAQLGIALYSIMGMYIFMLFKPAALTSVLSLSNVLIMPFVIVFPLTFMLGLIFPAVLKMYVADESEVGRGAGVIYSVNTFGCIIGSFVCGFIFIGLLGTKGTIVFLAGLNILIGLILVYVPAEETKNKKALAWGSIAAGAAIVLGIFLPDPFLATVKKAINQVWGKDAQAIEMYYNREGIAATTTAFGLKNKPLSKQLWINGVGMTMLCTQTKIMAHLPILLNSDPKNILIICFGMGTTLRSAWAHKTLQCDTVELVPEIFDCFKYFHHNAQAIVDDSRVQRYADDGRNFLMMRPKKYDVITIDPPPPLWSAGAVNLYTKEFFQLCKEHLQEKGVMCMWLPPLEFSEGIMIIKTFHAVFPNTYVWGGPFQTDGEFLIGLQDTAELDVRRLYAPPSDPDILADLNEWDALFPALDSLLKLLILSPDQLSMLDKGVPVITDDSPYTEFPLWRSLLDPAYKLSFTARQLAAWRDAALRSK